MFLPSFSLIFNVLFIFNILTVIAFINPQAIELKHLFDGIASSIFRQSASEANIKWIVFDGPVHCDWAENLNTVLDDNRKLCLSSGEALDLSDNMSFIFEVNNLCYASPSTVSFLHSLYQKKNKNLERNS